MTPTPLPGDSIAEQTRLASSRRHFLRGLGAAVALPAFESLLPGGLNTAVAAATRGMATSESGAPLRMAFLYFPNGANQKTWWPKGEPGSADWEFNQTMEPLQALKDKIQVIGGLDHINATSGPDGPGDHARASSTFLTGVRVKKTSGADIRAGVSIDQVVAKHVGHMTRFSSLELTCDGVRKSGGCDSGYSCAYDYNMSWRTPTTPMAPEQNPRAVFERLFGAGPAGERRANLLRRQAQQKSVLDFVLEDARDLGGQLGSRDRAKLEEYLAGVREVERRIEQAERLGFGPEPDLDTPAGIPKSFRDHIQIMTDMMALAFQTDSTRVASLILAHDGSNRTFAEIGIPEGHHSISHHQGKPDQLEKYAQIDRFYAGEYARFLSKLDAMKDPDGTSLLHNSMIVYGCGNGDGNRHNHDNLPLILAGNGGGTLNPGRYHKAGSVPMSNLFLAMADRFGVTGMDRFGDSTDRLGTI